MRTLFAIVFVVALLMIAFCLTCAVINVDGHAWLYLSLATANVLNAVFSFKNYRRCGR